MIQAKKASTLPVVIPYETPPELVAFLIRQERTIAILLQEEPQPLELVAKEPDWRRLCDWWQ
jgi:hypothetical protein